ncbi:alkaline phosphatase PhoX [Nostoc sp.]|uniref:alkaline phosphatase PhoX n=1 Tax=Nostoc sp. TaxID=1180 RepID=UPI002FF6E833
MSDPNGVLDLPAGFTYRRLSETGQTMNDGYRVPGNHDGMGAFSGSSGNTILIRNHELTPTSSNGLGAPTSSKYNSNARGGCTKLVVSPSRTLVEHRGVLAGTIRNCAALSVFLGKPVAVLIPDDPVILKAYSEPPALRLLLWLGMKR